LRDDNTRMRRNSQTVKPETTRLDSAVARFAAAISYNPLGLSLNNVVSCRFKRERSLYYAYG